MPLVFLILLIQILPPLALDEYAASLPAMAIGFNTSPSLVQLSISLFMLALGSSQLLCGPLSDRFGRRQILLPGLLLFLFGTLFCLFSPNITLLLIGRLIQGVGMGSVDMSATAITGDSYKGKDLHRVSTYLVIAYSLIPIIAPVIGGYLQDWGGWRTNFAFLLIFTAASSAILAKKLPETHTPTEEHKLNLKQVLKNYLSLLSNRSYVGAILSAMLAWSAIITFSVLGPFLLQKQLGLSAIQYGHAALFVGVAFLLGNLTNNYLLKKTSPKTIIKAGLIASTIVSMGMVVLAKVGYSNLWVAMGPTVVIIFSVGMTFPNYFAKALSLFPNIAGTAGAVMHCAILLGAFAVTALMTLLEAHSVFSLALVYLLLSWISFTLFPLVR